MMLTAGFGRVRGSPLRNQWFLFCVAICVFLVIVTGIARLYLFDGLAMKVLFKLSLAVENNVGTWTSGMLLLLLSLHAFDGYAYHRPRGSARLARPGGSSRGSSPSFRWTRSPRSTSASARSERASASATGP